MLLPPHNTAQYGMNVSIARESFSMNDPHHEKHPHDENILMSNMSYTTQYAPEP